ncbi:hypothetical protein LCGC14_2787680, partial [marine sediment metagenome]
TNDAPVAVDDEYSVDEDTTLTVEPSGVLHNDTDLEEDALSAMLVDAPQHALSFTLNSDGSFDYTPAADFNGTDSFTYKANDGLADSNVATVTITVDPVNDAPVADDDEYSVIEDGLLTVDLPGVLADDSDLEGDDFWAVLVDAASHGNVSLSSDGSFTYEPDADYYGPDTFTYYADDGTDQSNVATVTITVDPIYGSIGGTVFEDLDRDSEQDLEETGLGGWTVVLDGVRMASTNPDGSYTFDELVAGEYHVGLGVPDGYSQTYPIDNAYHTITIVDDENTSGHKFGAVQNDPPAAVEDEYDVSEDGELIVDATLGVLHNDTDAQDDELGAVLINGPSHASSFTLNADGSFTYEPEADYFGPDSFTYKASDGLEESNLATATITVNGTNDAPVAVDDEYSVDENTTLTVEPSG